MSKHESDPLSRRERQIMDVVWRTGRATALEIQKQITDAPGYSAVRALLSVLVSKGHLSYQQDGRRYVYEPTAPREKARGRALKRMLTTFFENSASNLVAALLDGTDKQLTEDELARIRALIDRHQPAKRK